MRLPLLTALGLLLVSLGALALSVGGHTGRSVAHLVTVPGIAKAGGGGEIGLTPPKGDSRFAVYVAPATTPPPYHPAAAPAAAAPAPPKTQAPTKHHRH